MGRVGAGVGISGRPPRRFVVIQRSADAGRAPSPASTGPRVGDTQHFTRDILIELHPRLLQLGCECSSKLVFQAPYQRVTKCNKMRCPCPKLGVLTTRMADD